MIVKIVISIPTALIITPQTTQGAALMGGHIDNRANSTLPNLFFDLNENTHDERDENGGPVIDETVSRITDKNQLDNLFGLSAFRTS